MGAKHSVSSRASQSAEYSLGLGDSGIGEGMELPGREGARPAQDPSFNPWQSPATGSQGGGDGIRPQPMETLESC